MEVLKEGQLRIETLVQAFNALPQSDLTLTDLQDAFMQLFRVELLQVSTDLRFSTFQEQLDGDNRHGEASPPTEQVIVDLFIKASPSTQEAAEPPVKKAKRLHHVEPTQDMSLYFNVNTDKADQMLRDECIVEGLKNRLVDDDMAMVAEVLIRRSSELTTPDSTTSTVRTECVVRDAMAKGLSEMQVRSCLSALVEETDTGLRMEERLAGGGSYSVDALQAMTRLVEETVASIVEHKFGSRYSRVWRILLKGKRMPQKLVEEKALMPPKDCKEIMFTLVREGFLATSYYTRSADYAPGKTLFLFGVDLEQVTRKLLAVCLHAIACAMTRRSHEYDSRRLLIERKAHVEQQISLLQQQPDTEQQVQDLRATFTPRDLELITGAENAFRRLQLAQLQAHDTFFILHSWLSMKIAADAIKV